MSRIEKDTMGDVYISDEMYYGAQTQRAVDNFTISTHRLPPLMIRALGLLKKHAALTNKTLKTVDAKLADAIITASDEVANGQWNEHFPIDIFQTGSGTSSNMNANEVIANRANIILKGPQAIGTKSPVHPNDHVNWGQSSNCIMPSAVSVANRLAITDLLHSLEQLAQAFEKKGEEFSSVIKLGRTHLQDAVPMTLGQEFATYGVQIRKSITRITHCLTDIEELPIGGTAIGTGIAGHPQFAEELCTSLSKELHIPFTAASNKFEGIAARDSQVALMGMLNTLATSLMKIATDLRILTSGPRGALGEITLPSLQPGSSIMPGKVNPVIAEMMIQVAAHINGKAVSVSIAGQHAPLELNMMIPLIAFETLESITILTNACNNFTHKCILGIIADEKRCQEWIEWSLALVTPLKNVIGYDKAAELAYKAFKEKRTIRDVVQEAAIMSDAELDAVLDPRTMLGQ